MTFQIQKTKEIPPIAIEWLKASFIRNPMNIETVESILSATENEVYLIKEGDEIYGAVFMVYVGKYLNIISFNGKNIMKWKDFFKNYIQTVLEETNSELCIMAQSNAWVRIFGLKTIGYIYSL